MLNPTHYKVLQVLQLLQVLQVLQTPQVHRQKKELYNKISIVANWNPYLSADIRFSWEDNFWRPSLKRV